MFGFFKKRDKDTVQESRKVGSSWLPEITSTWLKAPLYRPTNIITVYSCARLISSVVANTPIKTQKQTVTDLLNSPNPYTTRFDLISNIVSDLVINGNAFVWIDSSQDEKRLYYLPYDQASIYITTDYREPLYYQVTYFGKSYVFYPEDIIHFKNPLTSNNGYIGLSPVHEAKIALDTNYSQGEYLKTFNDNASRITMVIETDKKLNKESIETFQEAFKKKFGGSKRAGGTPLLHDGLKAKQLSKISPADADFLRTTEMTKMEIAEIFGVPPSILGIGEQKYSNAEQANIAFQNYTIAPILRAIGEELSAKLLPVYSKDTIEFRPSPLQYASADEKSKALSLLRNTSIITPNEARTFYDLDDIEGDVANKLLDELELDKQAEQAAPQNTDDTNPDDSNVNLSSEMQDTSSYRNKEDYDKEIHRMKTALGRLQKAVNEKFSAGTPDDSK